MTRKEDNNMESMSSAGSERMLAITQFVKYAMVGVLNTFVTFAVIYVCKSFLGVPRMGANALGYIAGVINSFIWNKTWVFQSKKHPLVEAVKFLIGFALCYGLQFAVVWVLTFRSLLSDMQWEIIGMTFTGYAVATIIGNVVYTVANFIYNRIVTFR